VADDPSIPPDSQSPDASLGQKLAPNPTDMSLGVLKAILETASTRWSNRRDYEWKLSYAFWTALAGFIATITIGKDSKFTAPPWQYLVGWLTGTIVLHGWYLHAMVDRTLQDIRLQHDVEFAMHQLDPWVRENLPNRNLGAGVARRSWLNQRYGVVAQIGITVLLSWAALWFSLARSKSPDDGRSGASTQPINVTCQLPAAVTPPKDIDAPPQPRLDQHPQHP
jgi:hypothetical protein